MEVEAEADPSVFTLTGIESPDKNGSSTRDCGECVWWNSSNAESLDEADILLRLDGTGDCLFCLAAPPLTTGKTIVVVPVVVEYRLG